MAESLDIAAVVAGGLTALGVVLDWGVAPEKKQRLQAKLEGLLYRFRYTTIRTFGRDEIAFSIRPFHIFGEKFFSWRRVVFVLLTYIAICAAIFLCEEILGRSLHGFQLQASELFVFAAGAFALSLSISYTLWVSRLMLRLPYGDSVLGTIVLLALHLALLILLRPVIFFVTEMVYVTLLRGFDPRYILYSLQDELGAFQLMQSQGFGELIHYLFRRRRQTRRDPWCAGPDVSIADRAGG